MTRHPFAFLILAALCAAPAAAQQPTAVTVPASNSDWTYQPPPITGDSVTLGLEECVHLALRNNLDIVVERYDADIAAHEPDAARGFFDLLLDGGAGASHEESPAASNLVGAEVQESDNFVWDAGAMQNLPFGGFLRLGWTNSRIKTNSSFFFLNPRYTSGWNLHAELPILRDFGTDIARRNIHIAEHAQAASKEDLYAQVASTILQTENAYWDLVYTRANLLVAEQSLGLARDLERINRIKIDVGTLAPIEIVQSEAGVATRQESIIVARASILDAEDRLKKLLNLPNLGSWATRIVPEDAPEWEPVDLAVERDIEAALERRPELLQAVLALETAKINERYAENQVLPRLNLVVDYGYSGLGGTFTIRDENGEVIDVVRGGYGDAIEQVTGFDYPGWTAGVNVSFPLQNRIARSRRTQTKLDREQGVAFLRNLEQSIIQDVRRAARLVTTASESITAGRASVRLAEKNVDAEKKKYENGMTTSFQILQVQDDLSAARGRELNAVTVYRKALAAYQFSVGRILERWNVTLAGYHAPGEGPAKLDSMQLLRYDSGFTAKPEPAQE